MSSSLSISFDDKDMRSSKYDVSMPMPFKSQVIALQIIYHGKRNIFSRGVLVNVEAAI